MPTGKRIYFDTQNRQIMFLDENGELIPESKRQIKDHIQFFNLGGVIMPDEPKKHPPKEGETYKEPVSVNLQTLLCSYCRENMDPVTEEKRPLISRVFTEKPEFVKTLDPPGYLENGTPTYGVSLYRMKMYCTNGHHFVKHYREWIEPRAYDFLRYSEEMELGLLDPLMPDQ